MSAVDPDEISSTTFPSVELLGTFVALMPDAALVVDGEGLIVSANDQTATQFGYAPGELVGRPIETLIPERFRHQHRSHRAGYAAAPRARPMGVGLRLAGRRRDGSEFPVDISLAPVPGVDAHLIVAAIRDVTDREAATAAHARLAAIVQSSQDAVISMSVEGEISSWNPGAEHLLGYTPEDMVGRHVSRLVPAEESAVFEELLGAAVDGEPAGARDTQQLRKDGSRVDVAVSVSAIRDPATRLLGFSYLLRDITARKQAEARLQQLLVEEHRQQRQQAASAEIRLALLSGAPVENALALICEHARDLLDAHGASLVVADAADLRVTAASGEAPTVGGAVAGETLAGRVVGSGTSTRVSGVADEAEAGPALGVPVISTQSVGGALIVVRRNGAGDFSTDDIAVAEGLAGQAALAQELGRAREDRESLLLTQDRERIARDLHDLVIQRLFAAGISLQGTLRLIDHPHASERINATVEELDKTIFEIRTSIFALETPAEKRSGPRFEILQLATGSAEALGFAPTVRFGGPVDVGMPDHVLPHALAVVREALSNVARHAQATQADVDVSVREAVVLIVDDNGVGIPERHRTSGLANLRQRAETLGGSFTIAERPGGGTRLRWEVPLQR
jgi:PAS domain S-box-containing protein